MVKMCGLCNNKIRDKEDYCWRHNGKPRKIDKTKKKKEIEKFLREYGKQFGTGYMIQLVKFRDDILKHFEKEKKKFKRLEEHHNQIMEIWEELYDEEYQVIPNKFKEFDNKEKNNLKG